EHVARRGHRDPGRLDGEHGAEAAVPLHVHVDADLVIVAGEEPAAHRLPALVEQEHFAPGPAVLARVGRLAAPRVAAVEQAAPAALDAIAVAEGQLPEHFVFVLIDALEFRRAEPIAAADLVPGP